MKTVTFKAHEYDHEAWKVDAAEHGVTLGEWIRRRLNASGVVKSPMLAKAAKNRDKACEHRLPPGTWCKQCETIRK